MMFVLERRNNMFDSDQVMKLLARRISELIKLAYFDEKTGHQNRRAQNVVIDEIEKKAYNGILARSF